MPDTPRSRLPNKGTRYGAVDIERAEHGGEKGTDQIPSSGQAKGAHTRQENDSSTPFMSRSNHNHKPEDKYGLPMYHCRQASPSKPECYKPKGGPGSAGDRGGKSRRAGWLILLLLALFVVGQTVFVVRTALQDMRERRQVQVTLSPTAAAAATAASQGQEYNRGAGRSDTKCVDLQALTWSRPNPLNSSGSVNTHHQGSQEYKYMWLSSTHLTLPLGSPLFALFDEHVRGDIGVLGSHASTGPSAAAGDKGGEVDVLVEVKVQSSASDVLQETGAWGELGKYELCRVTRTGSSDITSSPASASDPESASAASASPGIDTTGDKHVNTNNTHKSEGVDLRKITRGPANHEDGISFSVQLLLPSADAHGSDTPLYVPRLDIGVVRGDITVDVPGVEFGNVQLWTRDGAVHLGALKTGELGVHTGVRGRGGW